MKLHEISQSLAKIELLLENDESITEYLDGVKMQLEDKAKNLFFYMQQFDNNMDAVDKEIKRLQELKKYHATQYGRIKDYIAYSMGNNGIEKIETDLVKFSFRKSEEVVIEDQTKLDKKFIKEKISYNPDKGVIKKAIKEGEIVAGASLIEKKNLQVK